MQRPSSATTERCCFLLLQLFLFSLIFIVVSVRFEQLNSKQTKILSILNSNHNLSFNQELQNRLLHHNHDHGDNQWLVIQDRQTNHIGFNRTWIEYQRGFGNILDQIDFWIGNENLYWLTNNYQCRLKIELTDWHNETRQAIYEFFHISNQIDDYRIQIDGYNGNMEAFNKFDSFTRWHNNAPFSTYDHYATISVNCPHLHGDNGWWYHSGSDCAHVQLNGFLPTHADGLVPLNTGILWVGWKADRHYSFQHVRMAIQPKLRRDRGRRGR